MGAYSKLYKGHFLLRVLRLFVVLCFVFTFTVPQGVVFAQVLSSRVAGLPPVGSMVSLSDVFAPAVVKGITIHPDNPLEFDFIIDTGDSGLSGDRLSKESVKLVKYFLSALTIPDDEMWVNLSPYQKDKIVPDGFGKTDMGRDLLAQDYLLKQLTASMVYPEKDLGKRFWDKVYARAKELYGVTDIPMNTFNKVWIVADRAVVYEKDNSAYVVDSHLKVMMEEDYIALQKNLGNDKFGMNVVADDDASAVSKVSADVVREVVIPELEREVNEGKNFARLRQVYNSVILASWYKDNLRRSLLGQVYVNKKKLKGVEIEDKAAAQKIYNQYLEAFKKGVYNYVKEDFDEDTKQVIPRKYFSGGTNLSLSGKRRDLKSTALTPEDRRIVADGLRPSSSVANIVDVAIKFLEVGPKTALTDSEIIELPEQVAVSASTSLWSGNNRVIRLINESRDVVNQLTISASKGETDKIDSLFKEMEVCLPGLNKDSPYLFAITADRPPVTVNIDELKDEDILQILRENIKEGVSLRLSDAVKIRNRQPFGADSEEESERNRAIYNAALKGGLLGVHYIVTNIKRFSKTSPIAYMSFLNGVVNEYNGNLVVLLSVEKSPKVLKGDGAGMATAMAAVQTKLGREFLESAQIDIITDGGTKSRGGNWTGRYGYNGMMPTQYGVPFYKRAVTTLGAVRLQHKGYGKNRIYWTASDGDYDIGNLEYGAKMERDLEDDGSWRMIIHGAGLEVFDEADKEYVFGKLERARENTGGDYNGMEKLLQADPKIREIINFIKEEKFDSLGENFSDPDTGRLMLFKEKPIVVDILMMLKNFNTNKIIPNAFLVVYSRDAFLRQLDYYNRMTTDGMRLSEYGGSYFQAVVESQFNPKVLEKYPAPAREFFRGLVEDVFPKKKIIAAGLGRAGRFTDRGKTDLLGDGYLDEVAKEETKGRKGIVKRGNVVIGENVTIHPPKDGVAILENVKIDAKRPVELWLDRGVYLQNIVWELHEATELYENTLFVDSWIDIPLGIKGGDVRLLGFAGYDFYDLGPNGWEKPERLELYSGETVVGIVTNAGECYLNRTLTHAPYKGESLKDIVEDINKAAKFHPRMIGLPGISDEAQAGLPLIKIKNWMGPGHTNLAIADAKPYMDYVAGFENIMEIREDVLGSAVSSSQSNVVDKGVSSSSSKIASSTSTDTTNNQPPGGIDLNPALLDLQIKRDDNGVPLPLVQQPGYVLHNIRGFIPIITSVMPMPEGIPVVVP